MRNFAFKTDNSRYDVSVDMTGSGSATVLVNGTRYDITIIEEENAETGVTAVDEVPDTVMTGEGSQSYDICSPIPGVVISVNVSPSDKVKKGDVVAVVEAMKMENDIVAEHDGTVTGVLVAKGDTLLEGATMITVMTAR